MKVLLVDDSQIMRRIMIGALKKVGNDNIVEASNGQEAVDILSKDNSVGLVLMDWNMPEMSGIEALRRIREGGNKVPVIMVATESEKEKVLKAMNMGANDYLAKPFGPKDIQGKLERFLKRS